MIRAIYFLVLFIVTPKLNAMQGEAGKQGAAKASSAGDAKQSKDQKEQLPVFYYPNPF